MPTPRLSICIPTYNRAAKLRRTVGLFAREIAAAGAAPDVELFVSDNASPDDTPAVMQALINEHPGLNIRYRRNAENMGITGNMFALFTEARGDYVWYFSDDDIPFPGSLRRVLDAVAAHAPAILLFSFTQPPDSPYRTFNFPEPIHLITDVPARITVVAGTAKVSIYVLRRAPLEARVSRELDALHKSAPVYGWLRLPLEVLAAHADRPLAIISEPLAGCDDGYLNGLNWPPMRWRAEAELFDHPYVRREAPALYAGRERWAYEAALAFFWTWRTGSLGIAEKMEPDWWVALRQFPPRWRWLAPRPGSLAKFIALKIAPRRLPPLFERLAGRGRAKR